MKRFTLIAILAALALAPPGRARAHPAAVPVTTRAYYSRSADCGAKGWLGLRSRPYARVTQWMAVEPIGSSCQPALRGGEHCPGLTRLCVQIGRRIHHDPPHCFTQCFNGGTLCTCCDHSVPQMRPGPWRCFHSALAKYGVIASIPWPGYTSCLRP
jgi:hypothetical protein